MFFLIIQYKQLSTYQHFIIKTESTLIEQNTIQRQSMEQPNQQQRIVEAYGDMSPHNLDETIRRNQCQRTLFYKIIIGTLVFFICLFVINQLFYTYHLFYEQKQGATFMINHQPNNHLKKKQNYIAIQTVFNLQQNIPFMRQWLTYHIAIGVDRFYLYDNRNSTDLEGKQYFLYIDKKKTNKYGFQFRKLINKSNVQIEREWEQIQKDFKQYLIIEKWNYLDPKNRIIRAQPYAMMEYLLNYGEESVYTAFIDMDEYLFSAKKMDLKQILKEYETTFNFSRMIIKEKRFGDRFCNQQKKVTQIYSCIQQQHFINSKFILKNQDVSLEHVPLTIYDDLHYNGQQQIKIAIDKLRVNQYNINSNSMLQIKTTNRQVDAFQVCYDDSMKVFQQKINNACSNKCSDKKIMVKYINPKQRKKLCVNQNYKYLNKQNYQQQNSKFKELLKQEKIQLKKKKDLQKVEFFNQKTDKAEEKQKQSSAPEEVDKPNQKKYIAQVSDVKIDKQQDAHKKQIKNQQLEKDRGEQRNFQIPNLKAQKLQNKGKINQQIKKQNQNIQKLNENEKQSDKKLKVDKTSQKQQYISKQQKILAVHVVFIIQQNIPYIRQWLIYHINLGVDKFYMYDNSKSHDIKRNPFLNQDQNINKYGIAFDKIIQKSPQQIQQQWESIQNDFKQYIIVIPWQPKDENGVVQYQWGNSYLDYLEKYGKQHIYTAFIDIDQFIFSQNKLDIRKTLKDLYLTKYTRMRIIQKRFTDRFCSQGKRALQIYDCLYLDTSNFSPKNILQNQFAERKLPKSMHQVRTDQGQLKIAQYDQWRFNHYNLNAKGIRWMNQHKFHTDIYVQYQDTSMKRYDELINKQCKGKCADKYLKIKYQDQSQKKKICIDQNTRLVSRKQYLEYTKTIKTEQKAKI